MRQVPDLTGLPTVIESLMRPWVDTVETTAIGMGSVVASTAANTSLSLRRRIALTPDAETALSEAVDASDALARKLDGKVPAIEERNATLTALAALTEAMRGAQPSESTRALGLGW